MGLRSSKFSEFISMPSYRVVLLICWKVERALSHYNNLQAHNTKSRSNGKIDIALDSSVHKNAVGASSSYQNRHKYQNTGSHSYTNVNNQRRSLTEKSHMVLWSIIFSHRTHSNLFNSYFLIVLCWVIYFYYLLTI